MNRTVLAIAAHPDDIEFWMAGTLVLLKQAGWETHYFNLANGSLGSTVTGPARTRTLRRVEAKAAARILGAKWYPPIFDDMQVIYSVPALKRVAAVVRKVNPSIVLAHPPQDYMEDHTEACRLAVSAAFAKTFPNFLSTPRTPPGSGEVTVYHCMPHMHSDPLGNRVYPEAWIDVGSVMETKFRSLAAHASQKLWLDETQGMNSYLKTMEGFAASLGRESKRFQFAEGWRRHLHAGFCAADADPLADALGSKCLKNRAYRR